MTDGPTASTKKWTDCIMPLVEPCQYVKEVEDCSKRIGEMVYGDMTYMDVITEMQKCLN